MLDTNACIALINGRPVEVRARFEREVTAGEVVFVSAVVAFELCYGAAKSARKQANLERLEAFFAGPIKVVPFDEEDAHLAGDARAALEAAGTPIGAYDLLVAGQALRLGSTLVTANVSEFARVAGLTCEDWAH